MCKSKGRKGEADGGNVKTQGRGYRLFSCESERKRSAAEKECGK